MRSRHPEWETWFAAVTGSAAICALGEDLTGDATVQWNVPGVEHKRDSNSRCTPSRIWRSPTGTALTANTTGAAGTTAGIRVFQDAMPEGANL